MLRQADESCDIVCVVGLWSQSLSRSVKKKKVSCYITCAIIVWFIYSV